MKITCLHCYEENTESDHSCIYEVFDLLAREIANLKETQCGNSGLNFHDHYRSLISQVLTPKGDKDI